MGKGRSLFLLILLCALAWIAYSYLLPFMGWELSSPSGGDEKGITLFEKGDYAGAVKILNRTASQGKITPKALLCLGKALKETGESAEAVKHLTNLVSQHPSSSQVPEALFLLGDFANTPSQRAQRWLTLLKEDYDGQWSAAAAIPLGDILADSGKLFEARMAYSRALLEKGLSDGEKERIKNALQEINKVLVFSPTLTPDSTIYTVVSKDTLHKIAKKHNTTVGLIKMVNRLEGDTVFPGQELKIIKSPASILIEKDEFSLTVFLGRHWLKEYGIGVGVDRSTPTGSFKITSRLIDPDWFPPGKPTIPYGDERNILGTRWIGLSKRGYGIHGTSIPDSIGKAVSKGCVRMKNSDVEELFELVIVGTEVEIR